MGQVFEVWGRQGGSKMILVSEGGVRGQRGSRGVAVNGIDTVVAAIGRRVQRPWPCPFVV